MSFDPTKVTWEIDPTKITWYHPDYAVINEDGKVVELRPGDVDRLMHEIKKAFEPKASPPPRSPHASADS